MCIRDRTKAWLRTRWFVLLFCVAVLDLKRTSQTATVEIATSQTAIPVVVPSTAAEASASVSGVVDSSSVEQKVNVRRVIYLSLVFRAPVSYTHLSE